MEIFKPKESDPTIFIEMEFDVDGIYHLWMSISDYNARRVLSGEDPMPMNHPLIRIQGTITGMIDELIAGGIRGGYYVAPLMEIKKTISQAADDFAEGNGGAGISE